MKEKKLIIIIIPVMCALFAVLGYFKLAKSNVSDGIKFKNEYEALNDKKGYENKKMSISSNNPIKYSNYDEILDIISDKTGIIYLGFPECPWCRSAVSVLLDVAKNNNIKTIYYLNIKNERDSYEVQDDKLTYSLDEDGKEIKGTDGYFKLLDALDEYLSDYVISVDDKTYEVGEKRIYAPTVIFVRNGKILGLHVSTVTSHINANDALTSEQYDELYGIYEDYVLKINDDTCSLNSSC